MSRCAAWLYSKGPDKWSSWLRNAQEVEEVLDISYVPAAYTKKRHKILGRDARNDDKHARALRGPGRAVKQALRILLLHKELCARLHRRHYGLEL